MAKKKSDDMKLVKKIAIISSIFIGVATISGGMFWLSDFLRVGQRVEAAEQKIYSIEEYIYEQRVANKILQDMQQKQQQQYQRQYQNYPPQNYPPLREPEYRDDYDNYYRGEM